jgi:hypothetical protein
MKLFKQAFVWMLTVSLVGLTPPSVSEARSGRIDKEEIAKAIVILKERLAEAQQDLEQNPEKRNGKVSVKVRNYASIATAASFLFYVYRVFKYKGYLDQGALVQLGILLTAVSGLVAGSSAIYVSFTDGEYKDAKKRVEDLQKRLEELERRNDLLDVELDLHSHGPSLIQAETALKKAPATSPGADLVGSSAHSAR